MLRGINKRKMNVLGEREEKKKERKKYSNFNSFKTKVFKGTGEKIKK